MWLKGIKWQNLLKWKIFCLLLLFLVHLLLKTPLYFCAIKVIVFVLIFIWFALAILSTCSFLLKVELILRVHNYSKIFCSSTFIRIRIDFLISLILYARHWHTPTHIFVCPLLGWQSVDDACPNITCALATFQARHFPNDEICHLLWRCAAYYYYPYICTFPHEMAVWTSRIGWYIDGATWFWFPSGPLLDLPGVLSDGTPRDTLGGRSGLL